MRAPDHPLFHEFFTEDIPHLLARIGLAGESLGWMTTVTGIALVALALWVLTLTLGWTFQRMLSRISLTTDSNFDNNLEAQDVPRYLARIIPLVLGFNLIPSVLEHHPRLIGLTEKLFAIFFVVLAVRIARAVLFAGRDTLQQMDNYRGKPLGSYAQVISLLLYMIGLLTIFSLLTGRSVATFLVSMGAASAVLLLIFKDTILGFVASIQISANNMVGIGDWIEMPKYGADGEVLEINLTTVKVENWDKTITTVPTYALISDSFKNWRGMQQSGGRRIKRSIRIKMSSIRYLNDAEVDELRRIELLTDYIDARREEIRQYNATHQVDKRMLVNGRNLTNVGLFRKYMERYALERPGIHLEMSRMVRQLQPDDKGLPLELYCFTDDVRWVPYEHLIADIFDHLLASISYFGLEVFESPASIDPRQHMEKKSE
ncbi:MAG: mechanosensitive ion channel [Flavobacteriales bacterium]|nr:hypothetical protein [Flavobacteriales bacterium]MCC6576995.1 mechanosensitive ion channel [Flavobacteriales bacterium]NUQ15377.1 mechanosensitive ion channel [Flavobacteriales bacterium]